ncbi:MAG: hypothetical protein FJ263_06705 [Planctomycetes bacterium]|nr:hypothetical protein [Planctomycetota bacterium]
MENKKTLDRKTLALERVENLMLMAVLGQEPYRGQARRELQRRRLVANFDRLGDCIQTNLGMAY